jgi:hypothetical protein
MQILLYMNLSLNFILTSSEEMPIRWPRGLRRGSKAARLLGLLVRIPPGARMSVSCECCVLSGRGLCDGPMPHPEEFYRVWCVSVISKPRLGGELGPLGLLSHEKKTQQIAHLVRKTNFILKNRSFINGCYFWHMCRWRVFNEIQLK